MEKFIKQISIAFLFLAIILSILLYFKGYTIHEIFQNVVALTVSSIPEGLTIAMTIVLSIASSKMAKRNVIVKKLNAVESLGSCTVIATDKTGTLTYGTLKISEIINYSEYNNDKIIQLVGSIETNSTHPIAKAFINYLKEVSIKIK